MNKTNLYLDFDGTIANSVKAYCYAYWMKYWNPIPTPNPKKVVRYNLTDQCPLTEGKLENILPLFESDDFWEALEFFPNARDTIYELQKYYNVYIVTIGTPKNISKKALWIEKNLPNVNTLCYMKGDCSTGKEFIKDGIFVDDNSKNLYSAIGNRVVNICYGKIAEWNEDWYGTRVSNWDELKNILIKGVVKDE